MDILVVERHDVGGKDREVLSCLSKSIQYASPVLCGSPAWTDDGGIGGISPVMCMIMK